MSHLLSTKFNVILTKNVVLDPAYHLLSRPSCHLLLNANPLAHQALFLFITRVKCVPTLGTSPVLFPLPSVFFPDIFTWLAPSGHSADPHCVSKLQEYQFPPWSFMTWLYFSALSSLFSACVFLSPLLISVPWELEPGFLIHHGVPGT